MAQESGGSISRSELLELRLLRWKLDEIGSIKSTAGRAIDNIAMSPEIDALWHRVKRWHASREWFTQRGLPWRYGALLHGPPGTGKSAFVRAVAEDLGMPVFSFDLSTFFNDELRRDWTQTQATPPAIVLIEDIDAVFNGRIAVSDKTQLTFDALLNCIDGVDKMEGILLFVTTNNVETLDPALGGLNREGHPTSRPGRVDSTVHFSVLDEEGCRKIAGRILQDWPEEIAKVAKEMAGLTGAQVERRCIDLAEKLYWEKPDAGGNGAVNRTQNGRDIGRACNR